MWSGLYWRDGGLGFSFRLKLTDSALSEWEMGEICGDGDDGREGVSSSVVSTRTEDLCLVSIACSIVNCEEMM
jgi:hypothetical protein